jgi:hypothetical protein
VFSGALLIIFIAMQYHEYSLICSYISNVHV